MNIWRKQHRELKHRVVVMNFTEYDEILPPDRIANRAMYGTDYNPKDVGFQLSKALKHFHNEMTGVSIQEHVWVDGKLTLKAGCSENYLA